MPILLIIIGLLLMLFGGGCTLFYGGIFISDPSAILDDIGSNLPSFLLIGLAPLIGGFFLFRHGLRLNRERRTAAQTPPAAEDKT